MPICDRQSLAVALAVNASQITRWCSLGRIPRVEAARRLAEIFAIELPWLEQPLELFTALVAGDQSLTPWLSLVARAPHVNVGQVIQIEPPAIVTRAAVPESFARALPAVAAESVVRVRFVLPGQLWAGWQILLFSEDPHGFLCLLPRFLGSPEFPQATHSRFPPATWLECARLKLDSVAGEHSFVLVALRDLLPLALEAALKRSVEGPALLSTLDRLAQHVAPLCTAPPADAGEPAAGVRRLRFRVT
jgi:hypothetical protein